MSEDNKPIEGMAEDRPTGEMAAVETTSEADAPKMPEAQPAAKADAKAAAKPEAKAEGKADAKADSKPEAKAEAKADAKPEAKAASKPEAKADAKPEAKADTKPEAKSDAKPETKADAKPEATDAKAPEPEKPRAARETAAMPVAVAVGTPPEVPGDVENPTFMPQPGDVPSGAPTDAAKPPGHVPSGDSRSLRRGAEFALVYREGSAVITRFGALGTRGQWRVVEYPTPSSASNAYAKECSRFVGEGFSDYRD